MNKSDRQVLLMLLSLAAIVLCGIYLTGNRGEEIKGSNAEGKLSSDSLKRQEDNGSETGQQLYYSTPEKTKERFPFDPNTADSTTLLRLGLPSWQVRSIYRYRAAGGIFRNKEDFARLHGLTVKEYRELEPFIRISRDYQPASTLFEGRHSSAPTIPSSPSTSPSRNPRKISDGETVDLNISDTTVLKTVPGIGSYYARRIMEYGRRLGGYVSVSQLDEIEDLPDEVKTFFSVSQPHPQQLAINRLSLNELKRHPYINYYQARAITDYRRLHGPIGSLSDLRLLPEFPPEAIARLEPYVSYE